MRRDVKGEEEKGGRGREGEGEGEGSLASLVDVIVWRDSNSQYVAVTGWWCGEGKGP
jgi:hypothetical protein